MLKHLTQAVLVGVIVLAIAALAVAQQTPQPSGSGTLSKSAMMYLCILLGQQISATTPYTIGTLRIMSATGPPAGILALPQSTKATVTYCTLNCAWAWRHGTRKTSP